MNTLLRKYRLLLAVAAGCLVLALQVSGASSTFAQGVAPGGVTRASLASLRQLGESQCVQPPQHGNLMTLSDAQLSLYGLPPREILESNPAMWSAELAHYKHRTCGASPSTAAKYAPNTSECANPPAHGSCNWGGNEATGARGTYRQASVVFRVPTLSGPADDEVTFWAGVGGDKNYAGSSNELVQAGIESTKTTTGQSNLPFWEVFGTSGSTDGAQPLPLSRLREGDQIFVEVASNLDNDKSNFFWICDNSSTTSDCNSHTTYTDFSDSATGECIGERPGFVGSQAPLADFGTEWLNDCLIATNQTTNRVGVWPTNWYHIINANGTLLEGIGGIDSNGSFPLHWEQAD